MATLTKDEKMEKSNENSSCNGRQFRHRTQYGRGTENAGFAVYEFSRRNVPQDGIKHISVDVTDENAVQKAVGEILSEAGKLDVVVNCAGFGISGAVEFTPLDQAKAQFEVNFSAQSM